MTLYHLFLMAVLQIPAGAVTPPPVPPDVIAPAPVPSTFGIITTATPPVISDDVAASSESV